MNQTLNRILRDDHFSIFRITSEMLALFQLLPWRFHLCPFTTSVHSQENSPVASVPVQLTWVRVWGTSQVKANVHEDVLLCLFQPHLAPWATPSGWNRPESSTFLPSQCKIREYQWTPSPWPPAAPVHPWSSRRGQNAQ